MTKPETDTQLAAPDALVKALERLKKPINNDRFDYRYEREYNEYLGFIIQDLQALASLPIVQPDTMFADIKMLREALKDIGYAKSYTVQNKPMELVGIALTALNKTAKYED